MHVLKKIAFWLSFLLLNVFLVLTLVVSPVTMHLTNRESVKSWVTHQDVVGGIAQVAPEILSEAIEESDVAVVQITDNAIGIDTDQLVTSIREVITEEYLAEKITPLLDGVYDWLEGNTERPEFEVNLNDRLTAVVNSISGPLKSELAKLPTCPPEIEYDSDFNPISAFCVPPGTDVESIVDEFSSQITGNSDLDITISSDDIEFDEEVLTTAPQVYTATASLPYFFGFITLLFAVATIFLADNIRKGLKRVAWTFMINAGIMALSFWLMTKLQFVQQPQNAEKIEQIIFEKLLEPTVELVVGDIARTGMTLSLATLAIGAVIWLSTHLHHKIEHEKKHVKKENEIDNSTPTASQESRYQNKIADKTKKKK